MIGFISLTLKILFFLLPIFPWIKEYSSTMGNIAELLLIVNIYICSLIIVVKYRNKLLFKQFILMNIIGTILLIYALICNKGIGEGLAGLRIYIEFIIAIMGISIVYVHQGKKEVFIIIKYLFYITIILSILGVIQFIVPDVIVNMHSKEVYSNLRIKSNFESFSMYNRVMSLMNDPNVYSVYLIIAYTILNKLNLEKIISKKITCVSKLLILLNIILTNSRQGLLLYIIYLILTSIVKFIKYYNSKKIELSINTFIKIGLAFIVILLIIFNLQYILENVLRIDTLINLNGRAEKNELVKEIILNNGIIRILFGHGISASRDFIFENSYLLLIYQVGVIGMAIIASIIMRMFLNIINITKDRANGYIIPLIIFFIAMYTGDWIVIPQITIPLVGAIFTLI